jgi:hypothetical protein
MALLPDQFPGEKLLIRLSDTFERLCAGILSPHQIRRIGRAHADVRREEQLLEAQTKVDIDDILQGRKVLAPNMQLIPALDSATSVERREPYLLVPNTTDEFRQLASNQNSADQIRKLINLRAVMRATEEELRNTQDDALSDGNVEAGWLSRWKNGASEFSDEQMQLLWAKLLAGEIQRPGRYSLHTMSLLRNLSKEDAQHIARIGAFIVNRSIVKVGLNFFESKGVSYGNFLELEELGILNGVQGSISMNLGLHEQSEGRYAIGLKALGKRIILIECAEVGRKVTLGAYAVTRVGYELFGIGAFDADEDYLKEVAKQIQSQGFDVAVGDWQPTSPQGAGLVVNETWYRREPKTQA